MPRRFAAVALALTLPTLLPSVARADEQANDAEEPVARQPEPVPTYVGPIPPPPPPGGYYAIAPAPPTDQKLSDRTHNWLAPTGEMLRKGEAEVTSHEIIYFDAAIGITDNFELSFSTPLTPVVTSVGARLGLTPRSSPVRLVAGGSVWFPLAGFGDDDKPHLLYSGTLTAAFVGESFNLHGSMTYMGAEGEEEALGITNVGGSLKLGPKFALMAEVVQILAGDRSGADQLYFSSLGVKFMGQNTDVDLGLLFPYFDDEDEDFIVGLPILSVRHRF